MDEPEESGSMEALRPATHEIVFDHVDFAYVPGEPVLKQASFTVPDQKLTAIVGDSGSGKSTILNLIAKYYEPAGGVISIGGKPINHVAAERVLEQVADAGARRVASVSGMVVDGWAQANLHERVGAAAERLGLKAVVGTPLLSDATDVDCLAAALMGEWRPKPGTVTLFVGHGIGGPAGSDYARPRDAFEAYGSLGAAFARAGRDDLAVACLSDGPDAALQVVRGLAEPGATVRLVPLMLSAGRHVLKNIGGSDDRSWSSVLAAADYVPQLCDCGLGEVAAVRELFAHHARVLFATNE